MDWISCFRTRFADPRSGSPAAQRQGNERPDRPVGESGLHRPRASFQRGSLFFQGNRSRVRIPDRLFHREEPERRQHLCLPAHFPPFRGAKIKPAAHPLLGDTRSARHACRAHLRRSTGHRTLSLAALRFWFRAHRLRHQNAGDHQPGTGHGQ